MRGLYTRDGQAIFFVKGYNIHLSKLFVLGAGWVVYFVCVRFVHVFPVSGYCRDRHDAHELSHTQYAASRRRFYSCITEFYMIVGDLIQRRSEKGVRVISFRLLHLEHESRLKFLVHNNKQPSIMFVF